MNASWLVIIILHLVMLCIFIKYRHTDHIWLLPVFIINISIDFFLNLISRKEAGGVDVFNVSQLDLFPLIIWYGTSYSLWLGWFSLLILTAVKIRYGTLSKIWFALPIGLTVFSFTFSTLTYGCNIDPIYMRAILHLGIEPILLFLSALMLGAYTWGAIKNGKQVSFLSFFLTMMMVCLALRVLLALSPDLTMVRKVSHACYYVTYMTLLVMYFINRALSRWLYQL